MILGTVRAVTLVLLVNFSLWSMETETQKEKQLEKMLFEAIDHGDRSLFCGVVDDALQKENSRHILAVTAAHYCSPACNEQQRKLYLDMIETLLKHGVDPNIGSDVVHEQDSLSEQTPEIAYDPSYMYDLIFLYLQYGLKKENFELCSSLETMDIPLLLRQPVLTPFLESTLKTYLLLFPSKATELANHISHTEQEVLFTYQQRIQHDQETLQLAQQRIELNKRQTKVIEWYGGLLPYITYKEYGCFPFGKKRKRDATEHIEEREIKHLKET